MMRIVSVVVVCVSLCVSCTTVTPDGRKVMTGFGRTVSGIVELALSPFQVAAGLMEGISAMPYYLSTSFAAKQ